MIELLIVLLCALGVMDQPDRLEHHRSALPSDIKYEPYEHVRVVRWNGNRRPIEPGYVRRHFINIPENPYVHNPGNTEMFRAPGGGLTGVKNLEVQKWVMIPEGKSIRATYNRSRDGVYDLSTYPEGTRFAETLAIKGQDVFEVRCIHKTSSGWEFDLDEHTDEKPPGYVAVTDCKGCHKFAGANDQTIPTIDGRTWWGYGQAPGNDSIISFDPAQWSKASTHWVRWRGKMERVRYD